MQTCVAALRLPGRMSVERVAGCWWTGWPDGVECAVKLDVPAFMKGPGWKTWIDFFQSDAFEDIAGDTLTGLISGYIFYVLVQWMPRVNAERKAKKLLNSLVSGHVESFQKAEIFGHSRSLAEFDELKIGDIEVNRPWFSRHSPSSGNSVSHTLLETAA